MRLYSITVSLDEKGFDVNIMHSEVLSYDKSGQCKVERFGYTTSFNSSELDKFKTGLMPSKTPSLSIETIGKERIDEYIVEMKKMIREELLDRLNRTQSQLDSIES